ncbi:MAG: glucosamine-6-phosphate deaminase [Nanoarchaeota archaeon]|nr:glucosamine-6-phosphate deaminase [Nanoarchaeota archaeon]
MLIIETSNYTELSKRAANLVIDEISKKPNLRICFATGKTPFGMYEELIKTYKKKKVDFSKIISFNLDEYLGIKKENKNSYFYYMHENFFNHININKKNINLLDSETKDSKKECLLYERKIKEKPIDLMILGVGVNGHIGFNEPFSSFNSKTRVIELSDETIKRNSKYFRNIQNVPKKAITIGIGTVLNSKKIILLASGKDKSEAIKKLIKTKPDKSCPVTALRKHDNLIVILHKEAGRIIR